MVNILQNISQNRENKKITINDIKRAASLAFLSVYPGKTMYFNGTERSAHDLSHYPKFHIHYVKGLSGGKASGVWARRFRINEGIKPSGWMYTNMTKTDSDSKVKWGNNLAQSTIYPTLKVDEGKYKIILECVLYAGSESINRSHYVATDDLSAMARKAFKCFLAIPRPAYPNKDRGYYFSSVVIFTPKEGLFNTTPPEE